MGRDVLLDFRNIRTCLVEGTNPLCNPNQQLSRTMLAISESLHGKVRPAPLFGRHTLKTVKEIVFGEVYDKEKLLRVS